MTTKRVAILLPILGFLTSGWTLRAVDAKKDCIYDVIASGGVTCQIQEQILEAHNRYRQKVAAGLITGQPRASNMREMYWDDELAHGAQDWVNRCKFEHNSNDERAVARFGVGQNIAVSYRQGLVDNNTNIEFPNRIKNWFDENQKFNFSTVDIRNIQTSGHYTQVIWANTYLVGCGFIRYKKGETTNEMYACNYGPAGNIIGSYPYEIGNPQCDNELITSKMYHSLCAMKVIPTSMACMTRSFKSMHKPRDIHLMKKHNHIDSDNNIDHRDKDSPDKCDNEIGCDASKLENEIKKINDDENKSDDKCNHKQCYSRKAASKIHVQDNITDSNPWKKIFNFITINVFRR